MSHTAQNLNFIGCELCKVGDMLPITYCNNLKRFEKQVSRQ